jgi:hypothetical protein
MRTQFLRAAMMIVALITYSPAQGQDTASLSARKAPSGWIDGVEANDGAHHFIHRPTVRRTEAHRDAWVLTNFVKPKKTDAGRSYRSIKSLRRFDCKKRTMQILSATAYEHLQGAGHSVDSEGRDDALESIIPGTVGDFLLLAVCKKPLSENRAKLN